MYLCIYVFIYVFCFHRGYCLRSAFGGGEIVVKLELLDARVPLVRVDILYILLSL